jgi:subtilase family serine protease
MNPTLKFTAGLLLTLIAAACNANGGAASIPGSADQFAASARSAKETRLWGPNVAAACPDTTPGVVRCFALIRSGAQTVPDGGSGPNGGFTPVQLEKAYNLPSSTKGSGQLVAIVDAYDNPNVASDLAFFRSYFGLPAANFTKYNQDGQVGNYPSGNTGWGAEEELDVDMVSVSCPKCTIELIEANSNGSADLETAEAEAVTLGAHIVSNSWGCYAGVSCTVSQSYFDTPDIEYLFASGDNGYGYGLPPPAAFGTTIAVGGTSLYTSSKTKRGFSETAWLGTDSGCGTSTKPSWQHDPGCTFRMGNDVAALADPATGPAIYDTYGLKGWLVGGGTSTATPLLAGVFGLAGNASSQNAGQAFWEKRYEKSSDLNDITKGHNGVCSPTYFCTDGTHEYRGYGGPTGWGTPNGIGAF